MSRNQKNTVYKLLIILVPIGSIIFIGGIVLVFLFAKGRLFPNNINEYRGYKQGFCVNGKYEAWNGGAPTGNRLKDNTCLDKSQIDQREEDFQNGKSLKPAIFLYSEQNINFKIKLDFDIKNSFIYPAFNRSDSTWQGKVMAGENSHIVVGGKDHDYLFWEGDTKPSYKISEGNVVSKEETTAFLENILRKQGLNARETGDFITFWGPHLAKNEYNLISFVNDQYTDAHPMTITPKPKSFIRIFMVYRPVDRNYEITQQTFDKTPEREGFTLVEWGGAVQQPK